MAAPVRRGCGTLPAALTPEPPRPEVSMTSTQTGRARAPAEADALRRALEIARRGPANGPNPRVGAVLLSPTGEVLGEGWHRGAGTPHAEVAALADAAERGHDTPRRDRRRHARAVQPHRPHRPVLRGADRRRRRARRRVGAPTPTPSPPAAPQRLRAAGVDVADRRARRRGPRSCWARGCRRSSAAARSSR